MLLCDMLFGDTDLAFRLFQFEDFVASEDGEDSQRTKNETAHFLSKLPPNVGIIESYKVIL